MKTAWTVGVGALLASVVDAKDDSIHGDKLYNAGKTPAVERVGDSEVATLDQPKPAGGKIDAADIDVFCSSEVEAHACSQVLDSNVGTYWKADTGPEQSITVALGEEKSISGLVMIPHQGANSFIEKHSIAVSQDNQTWTEVAYGMWWPDASEKLSTFQPEKGRYLRLTIYESTGYIAELDVYEHEYIQPDPSKGAWGPTIDFPLVPVSGAVDPANGEFIGWASWQYNTYLQNSGSKTQTATWNPDKKTVSQREISDTGHDMFCTGITYDEFGNLVVTGGNSAYDTSIFNTTSREWLTGATLDLDRGYQSTTILSDGRIFMIGGSFSETTGIKNGAVYDPVQDSWSNLDDADVVPMLTQDLRGDRRDNHGWLFGWKEGTVFQAGPSKQMNWYGTEGPSGSTAPGGTRNSERFGDAMCGNAVMFDDGKILAFGGAQDYVGSDAINDTFLINIDQPKTEAEVVQAQDMHFKRTFHNSVVLPDGSVFATGGQGFAQPFNESTAHTESERFIYDESDPAGGSWEPLLPNTIPRVYHSLALLLQDGTVLAGGGGLCGNCTANHFDAQIYTPPYLLKEDGTLRERPEIVSVEPSSAKPGDRVKVTTKGDINPGASAIVRYGSATHTVDTDQRRLSVPFQQDGEDANSYTFQVPEAPGVAAPGYWMLFVLDSQGTPSHSVNVRIST